MSQANNHASRYTVVAAKQWRNTVNGARFLSHIRAPAADLEAWRLEPAGWTIKDTLTGEIGYGRNPWAEREDADAFAARLNELQGQGQAPVAPSVAQEPPPQKKKAPAPRAGKPAPPVRSQPAASSYLL